MSKPKQGRTAKKFVDSLLSELHDQDEKVKPESTASDQVRNVFLDKYRDQKKPPGIPDPYDSSIHPPVGLQAPTVKPPPPPPPPPAAAPPYNIRVEESVTVPLPAREQAAPDISNSPTTVNEAIGHFTDRTQPLNKQKSNEFEGSVKMTMGIQRHSRLPASMAGQVSDAQLAQAENLKLAQSRLMEMESQLVKLRNENELLSSAGSIARQRIDELTEKLHQIERARVDILERSEMEIKVLKDGLSDKNRELNKSKKKIEELEGRLSGDIRKVRVRERELENRLEISRMEKTALIRAKDETILDLKRNLDLLNLELESHKHRASELQIKIDEQQDQLSRTVRALRLALTNLESIDSTSGQLVPIKKAD